MRFSDYHRLKLGTSFRWDSVLPDEVFIPAEPYVIEVLGRRESTVPFDFSLGKGDDMHILELMRSGAKAMGITPRTTYDKYKWKGGGPVVVDPYIPYSGPHVQLTTGPLPELLQQLTECSVYVGRDSGPMCVADVIGAPTIGVFRDDWMLNRFKPVNNEKSCGIVYTDIPKLPDMVRDIQET